MSTANVRPPRLSPDERAQCAILLRADGLTWKQIAERLSYSQAGAAYNAAMRMAVKVSPATQQLRDAHRPRALEMLDQTWSVVEPDLGSLDSATREAAIRRATQLLEIYARWLGVPASQTPKAQRLARYGLRLAVTDGRA